MKRILMTLVLGFGAFAVLNASESEEAKKREAEAKRPQTLYEQWVAKAKNIAGNVIERTHMTEQEQEKHREAIQRAHAEAQRRISGWLESAKQAAYGSQRAAPQK